MPHLSSPEASKASDVQMTWGVKIPLRDGIHLSATLYRLRGHSTSPVLFTPTPYIGQTYHDIAMYFASRGYPFLTVDVRGRGDSEGVFKPYLNEPSDNFDVVEWLAKQTYCNGKVAMYGGSYSGLCQWSAAKMRPPHLETIVPVASPYMAVDFPMRGNISSPYLMQWLTLVSGRSSQDKIFWNNDLFWGEKFRAWFEAGVPFAELDRFLGNPSDTFQEWVSHPEQDSYWDSYAPTSQQYSDLSIPILTITGAYDGDQLGALMHYREHLNNASPENRARHYLIIGPWDHAGTRNPQLEFGGIKAGRASLVDLGRLHLEWYAWTMEGGPKPSFLVDKVSYYVLGADEWRYAESLDDVTSYVAPLYLQSTTNADDVFRSGLLATDLPADCSHPYDHYVYDPRDVSLAELESTVKRESLVDQRMVHAAFGKELIYHTLPFEDDVEVIGFFSLHAWLSIDQPDTDFQASVYEVDLAGNCTLLAKTAVRARYRESLRFEKLIVGTDPLLYKFDGFMFTARRMFKGSRLRLVVGPINSIYSQRNYNSGGPVANETPADARTVTVKLFHEPTYPSVLYVPHGKSESGDV